MKILPRFIVELGLQFDGKGNVKLPEGLRKSLAARGLPLLVRVGNSADVLAALQAETPFTHLLSHEETGPMWTYRRDQAVAGWCKANGVVWQEWTQTGVVRRLRSRFGWAKRWQARMDAPRVLAQGGFAGVAGLELQDIPSLHALGLQADTKLVQGGTEAGAWEQLDSYVRSRTEAQFSHGICPDCAAKHFPP